MQRGTNSLVRRLSQKLAARLAPPADPSKRGGSLIRRTLLVCSLGLFAGAAALGMVQQPDRSELPPLRLVDSVLPLQQEQIQVSANAPAPYISETRIRSGDTLASVLQRLDIDDGKLQGFLTHDPSARSIYRLYPGAPCKPPPTTRAS